MTPARPACRLSALLLAFGLALGAAGARAEAFIALVIDDLGNRSQEGRELVALPGAVTLAFLPHTPFARDLAARAHRAGKEVMLHLPLESGGGERLGPGGLTLAMDRLNLHEQVTMNVLSIPFVAGVNNHMGSRATGNGRMMRWLMEELGRLQLYFVDSRTSAASVAERSARLQGLPTARRDVFLDNQATPDAVLRQFRKLLILARKEGFAMGIGHPYPATIEVLRQQLPNLAQQGVKLLPVSEFIRKQQRSETWRASSSPSPKVAKN